VRRSDCIAIIPANFQEFQLPSTRFFPKSVAKIPRPTHTPIHRLGSVHSLSVPKPLLCPTHAPRPKQPAKTAPTVFKRHMTMSDVAAHVGASKLTVSRALNRSSVSSRKTSAALHQRILMAGDQMGYVRPSGMRVLEQAFGSRRHRDRDRRPLELSDAAQGLAAALEGSGLQ
jgi:hypothetical protein